MKRNTGQEHAKKPKRQRIGRLRDAQDVQKFIARMIRQAVRGGSTNDAYKATVMASMLLKAIEVSSLEKRIEALEQARERQKT